MVDPIGPERPKRNDHLVHESISRQAILIIAISSFRPPLVSKTPHDESSTLTRPRNWDDYRKSTFYESPNQRYVIDTYLFLSTHHQPYG